MIGKLFLLFVILPLIELAILIRIGGWLGFWPTMGLVVATGTIGAFLAKSQGLRVIREMQSDLALGHVPTGRIIDGFLILVGGVLLLTPGLISDTAGILLLLPSTRNRLKESLRRRFDGMVSSGRVTMISLIR